MIPLRVQQILMEFLGVPIKHKRCRSHTLRDKMCSKKRLNGSFFCHYHEKIKGQKFSESLITLCEMLRVQKYKYLPPIPGPQLGKRILARFFRYPDGVYGWESRSYFWLAGTIVKYNKTTSRHTVRYDDTYVAITNFNTKDWVYTNTVNTKADGVSSADTATKNQFEQDRCCILYKYGGLSGSRTEDAPHYDIVQYTSPLTCVPCYILEAYP